MCGGRWSAGAEVLVVRSCSLWFLPSLFQRAVGGHGFEFSVFVVGWRSALQRMWRFNNIRHTVNDKSNKPAKILPRP